MIRKLDFDRIHPRLFARTRSEPDGQTYLVYGWSVVDGVHCVWIDFLYPNVPTWVEATALRVGTAEEWERWDGRAKR